MGNEEAIQTERMVELTQAELDRLIDRKFGDGYSKAEGKLQEEMEKSAGRIEQLEAENRRLEGELAERGGTREAEEINEMKRRLAELAEAEKRATLVSLAARSGAIDPEIVSLALGAVVRSDERGGLVATGRDGAVLLDDEGKPRAIEDIVREFLAERPYLARANTTGGSGMGRPGESVCAGSLEGVSPQEISRMSSEERRALVESRSRGSFRW